MLVLSLVSTIFQKQILANAGDIKLTLATSFQCKLQNWAVIIGDKGSIVIPDFWRTKRCELYHSDEMIESYQDPRESFYKNNRVWL